MRPIGDDVIPPVSPEPPDVPSERLRQQKEGPDEGGLGQALRKDLFGVYRERGSGGDWWCQLDADEFYIDDTRAVITIDGGAGEDFFQIGQLYKSRRTPRGSWTIRRIVL